MPHLAVIIPSYNHAHYIAAAIESVVGQTLAPERIVIVDDGSTDASVEVIRAVADPRIELITQPNAGAHAALNRGILAAGTVDYIAILNSDDLFEAERLERCVAFLEANPECEMVCTGLRLIDSEGELLPENHPKARRLTDVWANPARDPAEWLGVSNFAKTTSNFVIRTAYARAHPFRDYRYAHDLFFAAIAAMEGKFAVLPQPLLRYRTHTTNTIKRDGAASVAAEVARLNFDLLRELAPRLEESPQVRAAYTGYFRSLAGNHSDFRAEVFLALVAQVIAEAPQAEMDQWLRTLSPEGFPELAAGASTQLRTTSRQGQLDRFRKEAAQSSWLALGTAFGLTPNLFSEADTPPERELSRLQKEFQHCGWVQLGRKLGLIRAFIP